MNTEEIKVGKLTYANKWPDEMMAAVKPVLDSLKWLVPGWCNEVTIYWSDAPTDPGTAISMCIYYEYRNASIWFFPAFLRFHPDERDYAIIHELLHSFSCVLADYSRDTIRELLPEDEALKFRNHAVRELTVRHESWVQDMAFCLHNFMKSQKAKPVANEETNQ